LVELGRIELGYVDYISLFYYLTKLKISFSEGDVQLNLEAFMHLKKHVKKTGFTLFLSKAKEFQIR
jgi:hypothetical protein